VVVADAVDAVVDANAVDAVDAVVDADAVDADAELSGDAIL